MPDDRLLPALIPEVDPDRVDTAVLPAGMSAELLADLADGAEFARLSRHNDMSVLRG